MKVFIRAPRRWIELLAKELSCYTLSENKQMFQVERGTKKKLLAYVLSFIKKSPLPPIEWFINYDRFYKIPKEIELIVEPGSKLINTKHAYIVYVENALGLLGFNTGKINRLNLYLFRQFLAKENLKGFVFYSETARLSTLELFSKYGMLDCFDKLDLGVIYPITLDVGSKNVASPLNKKRLLFCSSSFNLKGGRELVEAINMCRNKNSIDLNIVTGINEDVRAIIKNNDFCHHVDFSLTEKEYLELCTNSHIVVHPTFFDTHALSLLEAVKCRIPAITTNTFALKEYVINNKTGLILNNPYAPYNDNGSPNFQGVALDYAQVISQADVNYEFSKELSEAIDDVIDNYSEYTKNCNSSDYIDTMFAQDIIVSRWKLLFESLGKK